MRFITLSIVLVGAALLATGCSAPATEKAASGAGASASSAEAIDVDAFALVTGVVAVGDKARDLAASLLANGAKTIANGGACVAGLTMRELEGGTADVSEKVDDAFGLVWRVALSRLIFGREARRESARMSRSAPSGGR